MAALITPRQCGILELPRPKFRQRGDIAGGSEAEAEVLPHNDPGGMQGSEDGVDELGRTLAGDLRGEVHDHDLIDAHLAQQLFAALQ